MKKRVIYDTIHGKRVPWRCPLGIVQNDLDCYHGQGGDFRCVYFHRYVFYMSDHPTMHDSAGVLCSAPEQTGLQLTINFDVL